MQQYAFSIKTATIAVTAIAVTLAALALLGGGIVVAQSHSTPIISTTSTTLTANVGSTTGVLRVWDNANPPTRANRCAEGSGALTLSGLNPGTTYRWIVSASVAGRQCSVSLPPTVAAARSVSTGTAATAATGTGNIGVSVTASTTATSPGGTVTLTGAATHASADDTLTYAWTSTGGGTFSHPSALSTTWTAPAVSSLIVTLTLTATDENGGIGSAGVVISVANQPPTATASASSTAVAQGGFIILTGTATDPRPK